MPPAVTTPKPSATDLIALYEKNDKLDDRVRSINGRIKALRQLAGVGGEESVPFLAGLLAHDDRAVREYALAAIIANPTPAAGAALVTVVRDPRHAAARVALVQAIGSRRDPTAVEPLAALANEADEALAAAAIAALGGIGTSAAGKALLAVRAKNNPATKEKSLQAALLCADRLRVRGERESARELYRVVQSEAAASHLRTSALRGLVLVTGDEALPLLLRTLETGSLREQAQAAHITVDLPGEAATAALVAALPKLPPSAQEFLVTALADRQGRK